MSQINIGGLTIDKFYLGNSDSVQIYLGNVKLYPQSTPPTPVSSCYEIIPQPISQYASTTYDSVYSWSDAKWYMKNNLNQYEEYGVYDVVENISSATTYNGKLAVVGTTEYQYQTNGWVEVGEYIDAQTTYEVTDDSTALQGKELATTFKIPYADVEALGGWLDFEIRTSDGDNLRISTDDYYYMGSASYDGTVTNDGEYYYYSLPSEAPASIVIQETQYWDSIPIHLIVGSRQATVEYEEKNKPLGNVYDTVTEMEAVGCPTVGVGQYGVVGNDTYQFDGEDWNSTSNYKLMEKNADGKANVLVCNSSTDLVKAETQPSYFGNITYVEIGDCVTSIGESAFYYCSSLTSIDIPDSVISIGNGAFNGCSSLTSIDIPDSVISIGNSAFSNCSGLTSIDIPSGVTSISNYAFYYCSSLTSIDIPDSAISIGNGAFNGCSGLTSCTIGSGATSIGNYAFYGCSGLTSITVEALTPPTLGTGVFNNTNCPIYVHSQSVRTYKSANNWKDYASRIQAIPT